MKDFGKAKYTAVISDLHLCEAEPVNKQFPLWKKYKTSEFFFDSEFAEFLRHTVQMAEGNEVELILNGDIFDFDSVLALPEEPHFRVDWLEQKRGLEPEEEKSLFKFSRILDDHAEWVRALRWFIQCGHRVVFVIGNHDLELHWPAVQSLLFERLQLDEPFRESVRFCEWFYISNGDTFIEHGNQQDPYCLCLDPLAPFILRYNKIEIRLPFGNLASRYMVNGMGFINPHVDSSFVMSAGEYIKFFFIYMLRAQPFVIWTWFWGAFLTLTKSIGDTLTPSLRDPLRTEDIIEAAAMKANATPRMVRELKGLFARPATTRPIIVARELWLDRAFIILIALILIFEFVLHTKLVYDVSFFFMVIPVIVFIPFFLFYSRTIQSNVTQYKEPRDDILAMTGAITHTSRIVHGHTHLVRHEIIGAIEHLNPGCWSPSFLDVECTKPIGHKSFVWIQPSPEGARVARVFHFHASSDAAKGSRRSLARGKTKN